MKNSGKVVITSQPLALLLLCTMAVTACLARPGVTQCNEEFGCPIGYECFNTECIQPNVCGNGKLEAGEDCDFGGDDRNCDGDCTWPSCGDAYHNPMYIVPATGKLEECDTGGNSRDCDMDCSYPMCGDEVFNEESLLHLGGEHFYPEECDDGNFDNSDGCVQGCRQATCGDGFVRVGPETCDDGNKVTTDACPDGDSGTCEPARCGDGFIRAGFETCDDGNDSNEDGCLNDCSIARCGDGITHVGVEQCDDGNSSNTDDCPDGPGGTCEPARCGDGFLHIGFERCEDDKHCGGALTCSPTSCRCVALQGKSLHGNGLAVIEAHSPAEVMFTPSSQGGALFIEIDNFSGEIVYGSQWSDGLAGSSIHLHPRDLIGIGWVSAVCNAAQCQTVNYRITDVVQDVSHNTMIANTRNDDVWLYELQYSTASQPDRWLNACGDELRGLFVNGHWNEDGSWSPGGWTFSCLGGVIAKCARVWGYKPWKSMYSQGHGEVDLRLLHQACTRAARADYCGDGHSHTRDGTIVNIVDIYGFNAREGDPGFREEAAFSESGANWVRQPRWPTGEPSLDGWRFPTCKRANAPDGRAQDALLYVFNVQP